MVTESKQYLDEHGLKTYHGQVKPFLDSIENKADKATTLKGYGITDNVVLFDDLKEEEIKIIQDAQDFASLAQSYAVGTGGVIREDDETENAKWYYEKTLEVGGNSYRFKQEGRKLHITGTDDTDLYVELDGPITKDMVTSALGYTPLKEFIEEDPTVPSHVKGITQADIDAWNAKLDSFTETDPTVPSHVKSISTDDINNWNNKAENSDIPTAVSALTNDSGYLRYSTDSSYVPLN